MHSTPVHETWSSRTVFLLAAIGSAVGLGNIWRFPYLAGQNGGGAFVLVYLLCVSFVALPILAGEIMIGRRGRRSPINTMRNLAVAEGRTPAWGWAGWLAVFVAYVVMTFYSVIAGWSLDYAFKCALGNLHDLNQQRSEALFDALLGDPLRLTLWHTVFMTLTVWIVARGLHAGIEGAIRWMMPALFVLLFGLVGYAAVAGEFGAGLHFLLVPDFSRLHPQVVLLALSQAFFSVAIGAGAMMTYGAYLPGHVSIPRATAVIVFADAGVAIMAGLAIFPVVFAHGLAPGEGPGLVFVTLPVAFAQMRAGGLIGMAFFALVAVAGLTSIIATLEPIVAWAEEQRGIRRATSAIAIGASAWALGLGSVLSFNVLKDFHPLEFVPAFAGKTIFDLCEYISLAILLPVSGLLVAVFAGWVVPRHASIEELAMGEGFLYRAWWFLVRWIGPAAVLSIFVYNLL